MRPLLVVDAGVVPYPVAYEWQKDLHQRRVDDKVSDLVLLLEHPHVYTLGRRFDPKHLLTPPSVLEAEGIEVHEVDRGGSITYHGPGQLVAYPILDLRRKGEKLPDPIRYLRTLEEAVIRAVRSFGVIAGRRDSMTGVWVGDLKLASIGVRISRGVSKHGLAINVTTDLSYFSKMVPCGIDGCLVTSLQELVGDADISRVKEALVAELSDLIHRLPRSSDLESLGLRRHPAQVIPIAHGREAV